MNYSPADIGRPPLAASVDVEDEERTAAFALLGLLRVLDEDRLLPDGTPPRLPSLRLPFGFDIVRIASIWRTTSARRPSMPYTARHLWIQLSSRKLLTLYERAGVDRTKDEPERKCTGEQ